MKIPPCLNFGFVHQSWPGTNLQSELLTLKLKLLTFIPTFFFLICSECLNIGLNPCI